MILMKACRRLLLGELAKEIKARSDANTRWAIDGLAYLSLTGDVKEALIKDDALLKAIYKVADVSCALHFYNLELFLLNHFHGALITVGLLRCRLSVGQSPRQSNQ